MLVLVLRSPELQKWEDHVTETRGTAAPALGAYTWCGRRLHFTHPYRGMLLGRVGAAKNDECTFARKTGIS